MPRITAKLPKEPERNGLSPLAARLLEDPQRVHLVVGVCDGSEIRIDTDSGQRDVTVRLRRIEEVRPEDAASAERLLRRAIEWRPGLQMLPFDTDVQMETIFGEGYWVDSATGEIHLPEDADSVRSGDEESEL